jgi:putative protease
MPEKEIGKITHYFGKPSVGIIELTDTLKVGDTIHIKGVHDDFSQPVESLQVDHKDAPEGLKGQSVGIKVQKKVHPHDKVFKVE